MKERIGPISRKLTSVEKEIVSLRAQGYTNKEAGENLIPPLDEAQVKGHSKTIFDKYKKRSFKSVMLLAYKDRELNVSEVAEKMDVDISKFGDLSTQQRRVLNVFIKNSADSSVVNSNKDIARSLFISENTVKTHLRKIYKETHTKNIAQAITGYIAWRLDQ